MTKRTIHTPDGKQHACRKHSVFSVHSLHRADGARGRCRQRKSSTICSRTRALTTSERTRRS